MNFTYFIAIVSLIGLSVSDGARARCKDRDSNLEFMIIGNGKGTDGYASSCKSIRTSPKTNILCTLNGITDTCRKTCTSKGKGGKCVESSLKFKALRRGKFLTCDEMKRENLCGRKSVRRTCYKTCKRIQV
mmetsp:Transcript_9960/g.11645  ORF Transcript_9960/g.11645 Transcript_9960/m.11645 type:complete len:131 (-) Transcript_9960:79-471(-)